MSWRGRLTGARRRVRRPSPAMLIATLALFVAMSGTALAAHHYLITSTSQINPRVLKALESDRGPAGPAGRPGPEGKEGPDGEPGPEGKEGKEGKEGEQGEPGPFPSTLPSGETLTGAFQVTDGIPPKLNDFAEATISFQFPLAADPKVEVVDAGGKATEHCRGSLAAPSAASGYLCLYVLSSSGVPVGTFNPSDELPGAGKTGAVAYIQVTCAGETPCIAHLVGTWAVTGA